MTVEQLMKKLEECDPDATVIHQLADGLYSIDTVEEYIDDYGNKVVELW